MAPTQVRDTLQVTKYIHEACQLWANPNYHGRSTQHDGDSFVNRSQLHSWPCASCCRPVSSVGPWRLCTAWLIGGLGSLLIRLTLTGADVWMTCNQRQVTVKTRQAALTKAPVLLLNSAVHSVRRGAAALLLGRGHIVCSMAKQRCLPYTARQQPHCSGSAADSPSSNAMPTSITVLPVWPTSCCPTSTADAI